MRDVEARWLAALPPARRERLLRLREPADRAASLAGLALLLACARAAAVEPPALHALEWPDRGKPRWPGGPDFSISHGGGRVGCALILPAGRVGLDLEASAAAGWNSLRAVLGPGERPRDGTAADATALWVGKEAVLKAAGAGIAQGRAVQVDGHLARFAGRDYVLARPALSPGLACAVASEVDASLSVVEEDEDRLLDAGP